MWRLIYRLTNDEFSRWFIPISLISLGTFVSTWLLLYIEVKDHNPWMVHERFEILYVSSGSAFIFPVFAVLLAGWFLKLFYMDYHNSKAIYTYMTLPIPRSALYYSKLIALMICVVLLIFAHQAGVYAGYGSVEAKFASYEDGQFVMHNGLFLAVIRSPYLRLILPLSWPSLLVMSSVIITAVTGLYYLALCERSKRRFGIIPILAASQVSISLLTKLILDVRSDITLTGIIIRCTILLGLSCIFVWHSLLILRRGANV